MLTYVRLLTIIFSFYFPQSETTGGGGAISVAVGGAVDVHSCDFYNNRAEKGKGGAVTIGKKRWFYISTLNTFDHTVTCAKSIGTY